MSSTGIILYGPPASGKDTVTRELEQIDSGCRLFPRLKAGNGRGGNYRLVSETDLERLDWLGEIAWRNYRYGAWYAIDTPALLSHVRRHITILHLGQVAAVFAIRLATPGVNWCVVELWCERPVAHERLVARGSVDLTARLAAWDETERIPTADLRINTADVPPRVAAERILRVAVPGVPDVPGVSDPPRSETG